MQPALIDIVVGKQINVRSDRSAPIMLFEVSVQVYLKVLTIQFTA